MKNPLLIILGESPYNKPEQRGLVPFGYSREWIEKNNLKIKIKDKKFSRDSLGNFLKELARSFPERSFDSFDLSLEEVSGRGALILNCYEDSINKIDCASEILVEQDRRTPILALGSEARRFTRKLGFINCIEALHPSPRSRKSFVGSGSLLQLEGLLNKNQTSLEWLFFGVKNEHCED